MSESRPRILVIKHGALGDFVLALGAMQAIRRHHVEAHLTLLTSASGRALGEASGLFDEILFDHRAPLWQIGRNLVVLKRLRDGRYDRIYDLQNSDRTAWYARLASVGAAPTEWIDTGIGAGPAGLHAEERPQGALRRAGIVGPMEADMAFLQGRDPLADLKGRLLLLLPGGSAARREKRWPTENFVALALAASAAGLAPVLIGTETDRAAIAPIAAASPEAIDLCGRTDLGQLAALGRRAFAAIGNDTGPMHLLAKVGCRCIAIFGPGGDPARSAPRGPRATWARGADGAWPAPASVLASLRLDLPPSL